MNDDATNLDRMHDIVLPEPVPWWPPAPGWYVVLAACLLALLYVAWRAWENCRKNAYRREALRLLENANSACAISELLRRTALAVAPRNVVAAQVGSAWPEWLESMAPIAIPEPARKQLSSGLYAPSETTADVGELKQYARLWIKRHHSSNPAETLSASPSR